MQALNGKSDHGAHAFVIATHIATIRGAVVGHGDWTKNVKLWSKQATRLIHEVLKTTLRIGVKLTLKLSDRIAVLEFDVLVVHQDNGDVG